MMEELELVFTAAEPYQSQIVSSLVTFILTFMVMSAKKKKTTETPIQTRFSSLQNRLVSSLPLERTTFLTIAEEIHEQYKNLSEAYELLHGEEQKK